MEQHVDKRQTQEFARKLFGFYTGALVVFPEA